ncbi:dTDP-6-deoxy-3,4-keto-hexulose isomerase [Desulfitobacterium hafniense]|uniref:dTDP-6-deoxy-3,4-keto-hexulose isomerase n=1 Tax=Desulfitobacterium hafniense TaxID=49338 RepID=A0A0W1JQ32_DESHA|nr:FdtA/QdtA family cupin domain-containing protein [Desulfitobacterium hafniense]KTE93844.1 dTDP-6-deoxy-3,4-keto-hexulose isomerase [Desulfitobacterium hafniense]
MKNVRQLVFKDITDLKGHLTPVEARKDVPFDIKRVYYITRVAKGERRGFHSHRNLQQVLICVSGTVKILVKTPYGEEVIKLDNPAKGLYIGPMVWREMFDFTEGSALVVLASEHYDEEDYIRDYTLYEKEARIYFTENEEN